MIDTQKIIHLVKINSPVKSFLIIGVIFSLLNMYAVIQSEYWVAYIPFGLLLFFLVFFHLEKAILSLAFLVPLSINFEDIGFGLGISLPDEPMIIIIMLLSLFKFFIKSEYDAQVFKHPITIMLLVNFLWMTLSAVFSEMPFISFKFMLSRFWFVIVFYFMGIMVFKNLKNIKNYIWLYIASLSLVIVYTIYNHSSFGFSKDHSYLVMNPFYIAHGIYAAAIAFMIPFLFIVVLFGKSFRLNDTQRLTTFFILALFVVGLIFSYTRAAWLSVIALVVIIVPLMLRIRFNTLLMITVLGVGLFITFQDEIYYLMSKTQDVSSDDMGEHFKSMVNVKSDPSNAERINRWMSAIEMVKDKPFLGFGPGTYMFSYAPFQSFNYQTIISTNFGDVGNAHSEYLGMLSEAGYIGLVSYLLLLYFTLRTAFRLFEKSPNMVTKFIALSLALGMITYLVHGVMNNYTESHKIAILFWGGMAIITALDLYHNEEESTHEQQ
jgi:O-antigen ligase